MQFLSHSAQRAALLITALLAPLSAQTVLSGALSDATTGPLLANTTYDVVGAINIPTGATLTLGTNVVLKLRAGTGITVAGTLLANGFTITSFADDSVGADLTPSQATTGASGTWTQIAFSAGSGASSLRNGRVAFGGRFGFAAIRVSAASPRLENIDLRDCAGAGISIDTGGAPAVVRCDVRGSTRAYECESIGSFAQFQDNTASQNSTWNGVIVTGSNFAGSASVAPSQLVQGNLGFTGSFTLDAGASLNLAAGVIVKMPVGTNFIVRGTLTTLGTAADPVRFTSVRDDAVGGDTNADGVASVPVPGDWIQLQFNATSSSSRLVHTRVRYAARFGGGAISLNLCSPQFEDLEVTDISGAAMDLGSNSFPTVIRGNFARGTGVAVEGVPLAALPGFDRPTATAFNAGNFQRVTNQVIAGSLTVSASNLIGGAFVPASSLTVAAGTSLTLEAGVIVKLPVGFAVAIRGGLITNGTSSDPVTFTSINDDTRGGDTNSNGSATVPSRGDWNEMTFFASQESSQLRHLHVRYSGRFGAGSVTLSGAAVPTFDDLVVDGPNGPGLSLETSSRPVIRNATFQNGNSVAIVGAALAALPGFSGLTASNLAAGPELRVVDTTVSQPLAIAASNLLGSEFTATLGLSLAANAQLTLGAGVVVKAPVGSVHNISGTLLAQGTQGAPVVFTSIHDDTYGQDTLGNGSSIIAQAGDWVGLSLSASAGASRLDHTVIRYASRFGGGGVRIQGDSQLFDCIIENHTGPGLRVIDIFARPIVERCIFRFSVVPIDGLDIDAVQGFRHIEATGHSTGNYMLVSNAVADGNSTVDPFNYPNGALVLAGGLQVSANASLRLGRGTILKLPVGTGVTANGRLDVDGTAYEPVVITSLADDAFGGDTNLNGGASVPTRGELTGFAYAPTSTANVCNNLIVRYAGRFGVAGVSLESAAVTPRALRVDFAQAAGIRVTDLGGHAMNWIVDACLGDGIQLVSGTFDVLHATVHRSGAGLRAQPAWTGRVVNSIAWANTGGNFLGFVAGELSHCNGSPTFAGTSGNLNVDPIFLDAPVGNVNLRFDSPLINVGDPVAAFAVLRDASDQPRIADGYANGVTLPDLGAIEFIPYLLNVVGEPRIGRGVFFEVLGFPGQAVLFVGPEDGFFIEPFFGIGLTGTLASTAVLTTLNVGTIYPVGLVDDPSLDGVEAAVQAAVLPALPGARGVFTAVYRGRIFR